MTQKWAQPVVGVTQASNFAVPILNAIYDSNLYHNPAVNTQATVTFPATPNKRWLIAMISGQMSTGAGGAASSQMLQVLDGATILYSGRVGITNVPGNTMSIHMSDLAIVGSVGNAMTVRFSAAPGANNYETVAAAAYLID